MRRQQARSKSDLRTCLSPLNNLSSWLFCKTRKRKERGRHIVTTEIRHGQKKFPTCAKSNKRDCGEIGECVADCEFGWCFCKSPPKLAEQSHHPNSLPKLTGQTHCQNSPPKLTAKTHRPNSLPKICAETMCTKPTAQIDLPNSLPKLTTQTDCPNFVLKCCAQTLCPNL